MDLHHIYPVSLNYLPDNFHCEQPEDFPTLLTKGQDALDIPAFLPEIAQIELSCHTLAARLLPLPAEITELTLNPALELLAVTWSGLVEFIKNGHPEPEPGHGFVLIFKDPVSNTLRLTVPTPADLLALKIMAENISVGEAATQGNTSCEIIEAILKTATDKGLLVAPSSKIVRPAAFSRGKLSGDDLLSSPSFTLQWHITQRCDLSCRHCYDRSNLMEIDFVQGLNVLDQLTDFCDQYRVYGQVTFTGGNPLLHPNFYELYRATAERGLLTAILGNPTENCNIKRIVDIKRPEFYQVSLEGLEQHNDYIRGEGHFSRVISFLKELKRNSVYSMVMLTLTRDNLSEVLPLAEYLRDKTDLFTFNRLAMVGEGANLVSAPQDSYSEFLKEYLEMASVNPHMRLKDNLFNIHLNNSATPLIGGCAGYGCGAAFNFLSLLPDGELHACRKLPSPLGNLFENSLINIYQGELANKYRQGSAGCTDCPIRPVCGGCPAVSYGFGLDIFRDVDPYCFFAPEGN